VTVNLQEISEVKLPQTSGDLRSFRNDNRCAESLLVRRAQCGDSAAFSSLLKPYIRLPYLVALKITRNSEDAEDASQQTLLDAYLHINQFRGKSQFSTWLTRIAINQALMKLRKRRSAEAWLSHPITSEGRPNPVDMVPAGDDMHPEILYLKAENKRTVRKLIRRLPIDAQEVIWLRGMQELKIKETAQILDLSVSAVKSRFMRACRQLQKNLVDHV
jgi:RNA polymerase sigma-70 factor, ECF subfamily